MLHGGYDTQLKQMIMNCEKVIHYALVSCSFMYAQRIIPFSFPFSVPQSRTAALPPNRDKYSSFRSMEFSKYLLHKRCYMFVALFSPLLFSNPDEFLSDKWTNFLKCQFLWRSLLLIDHIHMWASAMDFFLSIQFVFQLRYLWTFP